MATLKLFSGIVVVTVCYSLVFASEYSAGSHFDREENNTAYERTSHRTLLVKERGTVGRAYSVATCDYRSQLGYSCVTCHRALHCYPGNVAIMVDCYGLFRFCRDGRCSRYQGEKCGDENKLTTPQNVMFNDQNTNPQVNTFVPNFTFNDQNMNPQVNTFVPNIPMENLEISTPGTSVSLDNTLTQSSPNNLV